MNKGIEVRAVNDFHISNSIAIYIEERLGPGRIAFSEPIVMKEQENYELWQPLPPTFHICLEMAQQLVDDLWQCGLRPSEGTGSAGQLASVQQHLADMRQIVFGKLKIEKP